MTKSCTAPCTRRCIASGLRLHNYGTVVVTLADEDKEEALPLVRRFYDMGFNIEATIGTADFLKQHGIRTRVAPEAQRGQRGNSGFHPRGLCQLRHQHARDSVRRPL